MTPIEVTEFFFLCVIGFFILSGNALVILAFVKGPQALRTCTNYFVVNLAVSDLLVGCISVPFWICVLLDFTSEDKENFKYLISLDILFGTTSILCLTAISLERMFAVKYPARHFNLTKRPVYIAIAITWITGLILTAIKFLFDSDFGEKTYTMLILILAFFIPLVVIIICYVMIFHTAKHLLKASNQTGTLSRELQVAKTISVIIGLFVICWTPFFAVNILYLFCTVNCEKLDKLAWLVNVSKLLHYSNSMMNFFVYAVRSPDFRVTFKALIFNKCNTSAIRERIRALSLSERRTKSSLLRHIQKNKQIHQNRHLLPDTRHSTHSTDTHETILISSSQKLNGCQ